MAERRQEPASETNTPPARKGPLLPILFAVVAAGVGGTLGVTVLGPAVAPKLAAQAAEAGPKKKSGGHGGAAASSLYQLENLVVNPAGSEGTRYLLVSVAIEPKDPGEVETLSAMDVALRHALLSILGGKTVQDLAEVGYRERLSRELKTALEEVLGHGTISRIYLPQYVIQ